jgi:hypothetical protein
MIETERYCERVEEIQNQFLQKDCEDISCYEAIALWFSEWVGDHEIYKLEQKLEKKGDN